MRDMHRSASRDQRYSPRHRLLQNVMSEEDQQAICQTAGGTGDMHRVLPNWPPVQSRDLRPLTSIIFTSTSHLCDYLAKSQREIQRLNVKGLKLGQKQTTAHMAIGVSLWDTSTRLLKGQQS